MEPAASVRSAPAAPHPVRTGPARAAAPGPRALVARLAARLGATAFAGPRGAARIGAEVELLVLEAGSGRAASLADRLLPLLLAWGRPRGWRQVASGKGGVRLVLPHGGTVAIEPGGQFEYAAPPFATPAALLADLRAVIGPLRAAAAAEGLCLLGRGIDPYNPPATVPLQIPGERYACMDRYFASIGPAGRRMMRQTAAVQVSIDPVHGVGPTWRMLNALAPVLVALFANSSRYAGTETGFASYRAETWRHVDPSRTGVFACDGEPAAEYAAFAAAAGHLFATGPDGGYAPLAAADTARLDDAALDNHLSTLFPEVRPRGCLEVRSPDAIEPDALAAPILLLYGLAYDGGALHAAMDRLGPPDPGLLATAARDGLAHGPLRAAAADIIEIAIRACRHAPAAAVHGADLEAARELLAARVGPDPEAWRISGGR